MELPQKISEEKIAFATQQLYTKIKFPCFGLGEEKRTKFWKKRKKQRKKLRKKKGKNKGKKKRNKPHCGQKWVGWDERVS